MGVNVSTYLLWETNKAFPSISFWPRILAFLGYYPYRMPETLVERILAARRYLGLSQREMAAMVQIDEGVLARLENGKRMPTLTILRRIENRLAAINPGQEIFTNSRPNPTMDSWA
jgi:DNA-binding XRE family transcriptional regulator